MAVVSCPKCSAGLKVPDGSAAAVRCPKCTTVFQPRQKPADPGFEVVDESRPAAKPAPPPAAPPPAAPKKAFSLDDAVRSADRTARRDDRDDDRGRDRDRRRRDEYEEDERPRGRSRRDRDDDYDDRRRRDDYADDYDDDYDRPRKGSKFGLARPGALLIHISLGLYLGGMALHALLVLVAWMGADIPYGLHALAGVIGLGGWITGLVGFGLTIAGPARGRGLAIAATAVSFVHLVLAFVVAYNERAGRFGGEGAIRWEALVTDLTMLDRLIAALVYNSKAFGDQVLPLFAGMVELARLILLGLLVGSLARAAKDHRAAGMAKFGWIAAPSAVGICMLVVLLSAVMVESTIKSATRPDFATPPQYVPGPNSFQENMRRQEEWRQQQQADFRRFEERSRSLGRTIRVWANGGELLVYTLHIGTLILPLMASFGAWRSMGRRR